MRKHNKIDQYKNRKAEIIFYIITKAAKTTFKMENAMKVFLSVPICTVMKNAVEDDIDHVRQKTGFHHIKLNHCEGSIFVEVPDMSLNYESVVYTYQKLQRVEKEHQDMTADLIALYQKYEKLKQKVMIKREKKKQLKNESQNLKEQQTQENKESGQNEEEHQNVEEPINIFDTENGGEESRISRALRQKEQSEMMLAGYDALCEGLITVLASYKNQ